MQKRIQEQEGWVNRKIQEMGGEHGKWTEIKFRNGRQYSLRQLKSKLRQEYHRKTETNSYILQVDWEKMLKLTITQYEG